MPRFIFTDARLDIPAIGPESIADAVKALYAGAQPVRTVQVSRLLRLAETSTAALLDRARRMGLVREVRGRGWFPVDPAPRDLRA